MSNLTMETGTGDRPKGADWHRAGIGGMWDEIGTLQFQFLVNHGLRPEHRLLDIGCGSLRGGVHFIDYLQPRHYWGIEKEPSLLEAARDVELPRYGLAEREARLLLIDDFDLSAIPAAVDFEFMLAQSVFTHLTPELIQQCLARVVPRLTSDGVFFATIFESPDGGIHPGEPHPWRRAEQRVAAYPFAMFSQLAADAGARAEYIGQWDHPRGQRMIAFRRRTA